MAEQIPLELEPKDAKLETQKLATRNWYLERLREKLKDPEFRQIEGFPIGEDEDILALSDPPYYTACPNPFLPEIIEKWQKERFEFRVSSFGSQGPGEKPDSKLETEELETEYHREPFAADVSEGKNDPIYNAHSYHTKVPHKAVMRYILHYTDPGDIVFDGFCGTGMTGVAAQLCGDKKAVESLGLRVTSSGECIPADQANSQRGTRNPKLGPRKAVLVDLSPAATFIAYNYNTPVDMAAFEREAKRILREVEEECGWMYETLNADGEPRGRINYVVWSNVFRCPECGHEMVFWNVAVDQRAEKVRSEFSCPNCSAELSKLTLEPSQETILDTMTGSPIRRVKQVPVLVSYFVGRERHQTPPDEKDIALAAQIEGTSFQQWFPTIRIDQDIDIWYERDYRKLGVYSVDAFFTPRNLRTIAAMWAKLIASEAGRASKLGVYSLTGIMGNLSKMNRWPRMRGPLAGTLYIPSIYYELNPLLAFRRRYEMVRTVFKTLGNLQSNAISTQSATDISKMPDSSVDYIFTDPPFGSNIIYSDLSIIWESWLKVATNISEEAVIHRRKHVTTQAVVE